MKKSRTEQVWPVHIKTKAKKAADTMGLSLTAWTLIAIKEKLEREK